MPTCNSCGKPINWILTKNGRKMPVDTNEVPFIPDETAKHLALDTQKNLIKGRTCAESYEDEPYIYARLSHFASCPNANEHRR